MLNHVRFEHSHMQSAEYIRLGLGQHGGCASPEKRSHFQYMWPPLLVALPFTPWPILGRFKGLNPRKATTFWRLFFSHIMWWTQWHIPYHLGITTLPPIYGKLSRPFLDSQNHPQTRCIHGATLMASGATLRELLRVLRTACSTWTASRDAEIAIWGGTPYPQVIQIRSFYWNPWWLGVPSF